MSECGQRLGIDIIGHLAFGYALNLQTDETYQFLPSALSLGKTRINAYMQFPALRKLDGLFKYLGRRQRERILDMLRTMVASRTSEGKHAKHDFYSFAAGSLHEGSPTDFENSELCAEATFFITAGVTPPVTTICALLFYLSRNPQCYKVLAEEIRSTFQSDEEIKGGAKLQSCKYLRACIDESLRLAPPSLAVPWWEQSAHDDEKAPIVIDGNVIPRGTQVGVSIYALHHNEEYFPDAFSFIPERWLAPSTPESLDGQAGRGRMHKAFVPFIVGPRACAGKAMAYLEVSLVIAKILWHFDFAPADGPLGKVGGGQPGRKDGRNRVDEFQLFDVFNSTHDGPYLVFRSRSNLAEVSSI
ncbi:hypothetical protein DL762_001315 [Monosporascus cannonballus]|uniref:Cytochrome P450 n=1 Tax=Monosporascus cannonballus TaxID=155416 RepID=A0ABY0HGP9_9PEZI|nr:hypothetical protein DL762_001315 [Monosporascus cannonballus]